MTHSSNICFLLEPIHLFICLPTSLLAFLSEIAERKIIKFSIMRIYRYIYVCVCLYIIVLYYVIAAGIVVVPALQKYKLKLCGVNIEPHSYPRMVHSYLKHYFVCGKSFTKFNEQAKCTLVFFFFKGVYIKV